MSYTLRRYRLRGQPASDDERLGDDVTAATVWLCRVIGHRWAWIFEGDWECARCGGLRTNIGYVVPSRFASAWRPK